MCLVDDSIHPTTVKRRIRRKAKMKMMMKKKMGMLLFVAMSVMLIPASFRTFLTVRTCAGFSPSSSLLRPVSQNHHIYQTFNFFSPVDQVLLGTKAKMMTANKSKSSTSSSTFTTIHMSTNFNNEDSETHASSPSSTTSSTTTSTKPPPPPRRRQEEEEDRNYSLTKPSTKAFSFNLVKTETIPPYNSVTKRSNTRSPRRRRLLEVFKSLLRIISNLRHYRGGDGDGDDDPNRLASSKDGEDVAAYKFTYDCDILELDNTYISGRNDNKDSKSNSNRNNAMGVILIHPVGVGIGRWFYQRLFDALPEAYALSSSSSLSSSKLSSAVKEVISDADMDDYHHDDQFGSDNSPSSYIIAAPDLLGSSTGCNATRQKKKKSTTAVIPNTSSDTIPLTQAEDPILPHAEDEEKVTIHDDIPFLLFNVSDWTDQLLDLMVQMEGQYPHINKWAVVANGGCSPIALQIAARSVVHRQKNCDTNDKETFLVNNTNEVTTTTTTTKPHIPTQPVTNVILSSVPRLPFFLSSSDPQTVHESYKTLCGWPGRLFWWYACRNDGAFIQKFSEKNLVADPSNLGDKWRTYCYTTATSYGGLSRYSTFSFLAGTLQDGCTDSLRAIKDAPVQVDIIKGNDQRRNKAKSWFWQKKKGRRRDEDKAMTVETASSTTSNMETSLDDQESSPSSPPPQQMSFDQYIEDNGNGGRTTGVSGRISLAHEDGEGYADAMMFFLSNDDTAFNTPVDLSPTSESSLPSSSFSISNLDIKKDQLTGNLVLLTVPLSWGSYAPVVRGLSQLDPPVPGFIFSAAYYLLAAATLTSIIFIQQQEQQEDDENTKNDFKSINDNDVNSAFPLWGGIELGSYLFFANCLQVVGLQTVESDRAGFLVQLTTVLVPILEAIFAGNLLAVPVRVWLACILAFLGVVIMGFDNVDGIAMDKTTMTQRQLWDNFDGTFASLTQGDVLILGAAVLYSMHVVRLSGYARKTMPLKLASAKAVVESIFSVLLVISLIGLSSAAVGENTIASGTSLIGFATEVGTEIRMFLSSFTAGILDGTLSKDKLVPAFGAVLWTGWVTCSYTIWAQSFGQARVSPTSANLIYTAQPLFTALFAFFLLGETMGPAGFAGGTLIASAVYIVALSNEQDTSTSFETMTKRET